MTEHSKLRLKLSCITRFLSRKLIFKHFFKHFAWQRLPPIHLNIQYTLYAHLSQCNTVNKEKELTKTCQFCVVQKFKSGIPYERSWIGCTTLVIIQQIFTQTATVKCPNFATCGLLVTTVH